jgi:hypothetical protein
MRNWTGQFEEIWLVDTEFRQDLAENPTVHCLVARELNSQRLIRLRAGEFPTEPPFRTDSRALFVAYLASAELNCFRQLGWKDPANVLDLYVEHRWLKNNLPVPPDLRPYSLLVLLEAVGGDPLSVVEKQEMRNLAIRGGPFTEAEWKSLLAYCQSDVDALATILPRIAHKLDWPRALLRGEYMKSVAEIETTGVPIDRDKFGQFATEWGRLRRHVLDQVAVKFPVFEDGRFVRWKFIRFLQESGLLLDWPRTATRMPKTDSDTFREQARLFPWLEPLKEALATGDVLKSNQLAIGADGRNRAMLSPFKARTGRNQPSNSKFIFGPATWLRGLIQPDPGWSLAYIDWSQQELGIGACLSGDARMLATYQDEDPYLFLAKLAGAVPKSATRDSHPIERELFKRLSLGTQYGMGPVSMARSMGTTVARAEHLLQQHHEIFRTFWKWSDSAVNYAQLNGHIHTRFGWRVFIDHDPNVRALRNFPMQANGAEMLRLACILCHRQGITIHAPVHDALMIGAPTVDIQDAVRTTQNCMAEASRLVLDGFPLKSDAHVVTWPDRYMDKRGQATWATMCGVLAERRPASQGSISYVTLG